MIRRPPRSTPKPSSAASDVYKRQSWGLTCPMDTPEGSGCGLTKSLAMSAHIRVGTFSTAACEQLDILQARLEGLHAALTAQPIVRRNGVPILVNGCLYMYAESPQHASIPAKELRALRRSFMIPFDTTVALNDGMLHVDTCLLYTSPSPRDRQKSRMPSSA